MEDPKLCTQIPATAPADCLARHNAYCEAKKCFPGNPWLDCVCTASGQVCAAADAFTFTGREGTELAACAWASQASPGPINDKGNWFLRWRADRIASAGARRVPNFPGILLKNH